MEIAMLESLTIKDRVVNFVFASRSAMEELNRKFRGRDGATDVLSFCLETPDKDDFPGDIDPWGEVYICPDIARENAARDNIPLRAEIRRLMVHGLLHLLGFDHHTPDEYKRMIAMERNVLADLQGEEL